MSFGLVRGAIAALAAMAVSASAAPIVDNFNITIDWDENFVTGGGSGYNGGEWFYYQDTGWWNEWFYDHPFDPNRWKEIHIEFDAAVLDPGLDLWLDFAVNWSTPEWDQVPGHEGTPPIPGFPGFDEGLHIERFTFLTTQFFLPDASGYEHFSFDFIIPDYNPEWVSIDVSGWNFEIINGVITHDCIPAPGTMGLLAAGGLLAFKRRR